MQFYKILLLAAVSATVFSSCRQSSYCRCYNFDNEPTYTGTAFSGRAAFKKAQADCDARQAVAGPMQQCSVTASR